jgi:V8-like Glu-specific endopeptidase
LHDDLKWYNICDDIFDASVNVDDNVRVIGHSGDNDEIFKYSDGHVSKIKNKLFYFADIFTSYGQSGSPVYKIDN